jgi:hypothetical protein
MLDPARYGADMDMPTAGIALFVLLVVVLLALPIVFRRYLGDLRRARRIGMEIWMGTPNPSGGSYVPHDDLAPSPRDRLRLPPQDDD